MPSETSRRAAGYKYKHRSVRRDSNSYQEDVETSTESTFNLFSAKTVIPLSCFIIALCIAYKGYLETRINTPFSSVKVVQKSGLAVPDRYWGSYRPNVYFGMKTRDPHSLVTGLMWFYPQYIVDVDGIRHWCEQADYLKGYSWVEHDGRNYGIQVIMDEDVTITTSFVKKLRGGYGGDWTARISFGTPFGKDVNGRRNGEDVTLILYTAIENQTNGVIETVNDVITGVVGVTQGLGNFSIKFSNSTQLLWQESHLVTKCELDTIKETIARSVVAQKHADGKLEFSFQDNKNAESDGKSNFIFTMITLRMPFSVDVIFESQNAFRPESMTGDVFTAELSKHQKSFSEKFDNIFKLETKGFNKTQILFAKAAFSNLIGGIGYFYGASKVLSEHTDAPVPYWKSPLYTAVPSRSFFPRGFLWDEGFHGLLIATWDLDIELDIISHWFDLMNVEGWIPREQILGPEALKRVPEEFVTQVNTNANPPVFFLTLQFILENYEEQLIGQASRLETLDRLYSRLVAWFDWFNTTQTGPMPGTYRWRGRDPNATNEINPKTLTSGMDDYPRPSHPTEDERHVDLRCWMALSASTLASISNLLKKNGKRFAQTAAYLSDNNLLDEYHWSKRTETYADFGLHTDQVVLLKEQNFDSTKPKDRRFRLNSLEFRFADEHFGYNSLYPMMLQILDPGSPKLGKLLQKLKDPTLLWTDYGLRSLATTSPLYMVRNTPHDPPYWRGAIWINMNYLVVRALWHYGNVEGPYNKLAMDLYAELRKNVIDNIFREYKKTGYLWEHYSDTTGAGEGSRPFTGWTSLVVLLMAEIY